MTNYTASRLGMKNGTGADDALFLKQFAGEILTIFGKNNVLMSRHTVRTIHNGSSAQFPVIGGVSAVPHTRRRDHRGIHQA